MPGPGRQAQTHFPALVGRTERALVHCPPGSHRSFSQPPSARLCRYVGPGEARAWQRGCQGLAGRCELQESGLGALAEARAALRIWLCGSPSQGSMRLGLQSSLDRENSISLWSLSQLPRRPGGGCPRAPLQDGWSLRQPGPHCRPKLLSQEAQYPAVHKSNLSFCSDFPV